jgi:hypothetical protein
VAPLATQFWNYQQNLAYRQAAPFAVVMIAIAAIRATCSAGSSTVSPPLPSRTAR